MIKSRTLVLALSLSLSLSTLSSVSLSPTLSTGPTSAALADVQGNGPPWGAIFACAACGAGAVGLIMSGWGAIVAAANMPGSTIAVAACVAVCLEAFD